MVRNIKLEQFPGVCVIVCYIHCDNFPGCCSEQENASNQGWLNMGYKDAWVKTFQALSYSWNHRFQKAKVISAEREGTFKIFKVTFN